jgi:hypothetical protein
MVTYFIFTLFWVVLIFEVMVNIGVEKECGQVEQKDTYPLVYRKVDEERIF